MQPSNVNRRGFHKLTMAAFGGMVAGAGASALGQEKEADKPQVNVDPALLLSEPHVCRGLNTCKGKSKGDNYSRPGGLCCCRGPFLRRRKCLQRPRRLRRISRAKHLQGQRALCRSSAGEGLDPGPHAIRAVDEGRRQKSRQSPQERISDLIESFWE